MSETQAVPGELGLGETRIETDLLSRLEEGVARLVERQRESGSRYELLENRLREREREIVELRKRIDALERQRATAVSRLDAVILEVERLEKGEGASR